MTDVLVLNSSYSPIDIVSDRDAVCMLYQNKAYTVHESEREMRSPSLSFKVPHVVALIKYKKIPRRSVGLSKLNVIYRDDMTCQYCGDKFNMNDLTIDHIIPKSRWKEVMRTNKRNWTNWMNCVCSCKWCNNWKGNRLLEETSLSLLRQPYVPKYMPKLVIDFKKAEAKGWLPYCTVNVRVINTL